MFEKVNPMHPDKIADRIAGAIVDLAYRKEENPKIAVEVLVGHNECNVIIESSCEFTTEEIKVIINRLATGCYLNLKTVPQDKHLAINQRENIRCGDNGIFKGVPVTTEQFKLTRFAKKLYNNHPYDGKFIIEKDRLIVCQSNVDSFAVTEELKQLAKDNYCEVKTVNPLGEWTGGTDVDSGATNRKLGSDMGDSVTGGGLHGKDLSKADVSVNIYAFLKAQQTLSEVELYCAIGDEYIDGKPYSEIVDIAREYINAIGGFEKFAEWGLIR